MEINDVPGGGGCAQLLPQPLSLGGVGIYPVGFCVQDAEGMELEAALRKLREKSRGLPVVHPLYSRVYHSHPPLLERLRAMGALYSPLSSAEGP